MGLESATFINDLTTTNPASGDNLSQGDDHLRLVKDVLKSTFPSANRAWYMPTGLAKSGAYTIKIADESAFVPCDASGGAFALELPIGSTLNDGFKFTAIKADTGPNAVTINRASTDTINGAASYVLTDPYEGADFIWTGTEWLVRHFGNNSVKKTGDVEWRLEINARIGFVKMNGTTMGNASSGAAQRANADTENLFNYIWDNVADVVAAVSGGRGANAPADFAANKTIIVPTLQGRTQAGLDTMGGSAAGIISDTYITGGGGDSDLVGGTGGGQKTTFLEENLPAMTISGTTDGHAHGHNRLRGTGSTNRGTNPVVAGAINSEGTDTTDPATDTFTSDSFGSGTDFTNLSPTILGTFYMKL